MSGVRPANRGNRSANRIGSVVSRRLRAAGWNIAPAAMRHKRDVTTVSAQGNRVSVLADTGLDGRNLRIAKGILNDVACWPEVSDTDMVVTESGAVFVWFDYTSAASVK